ncbi:MAG: UDP-3-O-(3-hydroxymyristoyl)glucosamine N-acyltransferase [Saprospiraceae bacterium]
MKIVAQSASDIALLTNGRIEGDSDRKICNICKINEPQPNSLCFLANLKYEKFLYSNHSMTVLVEEGFIPKLTSKNTLIYVNDVYAKFSKVLKLYSKNENLVFEIDKLSAVSKNTVIGKRVNIGKFTVVQEGSEIGDGSNIMDQVYIGKNVIIGNNVLIYPGVKIYDLTVIGDDVVIHSNAVIGSDGFGFSVKEKEYDKIPQIGNVIIEGKVEIGSCTTIDRATIGSTLIKKGAKLDNLIQIGHNVVIGEHAVIAAQTGIAGSTEIGAGSMLGGQVGIAGHLKIAPYSQIQAKSGVASSIVDSGKKWYGYPILPYTDYLKSYSVFKILPRLLKRIVEIEEKLKNVSFKNERNNSDF